MPHPWAEQTTSINLHHSFIANVSDIDECLEDDLNLCEQLCENSEGSYECTCDAGFQLDANQLNCTDIDECNDTLLHDCQGDASECVNVPGSYYCGCQEGYTWSEDKSNCTGRWLSFT